MSVTAIVYAYSTERRAFPFPEYCEIFRENSLTALVAMYEVPINPHYTPTPFLQISCCLVPGPAAAARLPPDIKTN